MKVYCASGTLWRMHVLNWSEDMKLKKIFSGKFQGLKDNLSIGRIIDELHTTGMLKEWSSVVLKPFFGFGLWNRFILRIRGYKKDEFIMIMKNPTIAQVLVDFFYINVSWMSAYLTFAGISDLKMKEEIPIFKDIIRLKNPLYPSVLETSRGQNGS